MPIGCSNEPSKICGREFRFPVSAFFWARDFKTNQSTLNLYSADTAIQERSADFGLFFKLALVSLMNFHSSFLLSINFDVAYFTSCCSIYSVLSNPSPLRP